MTIRIEADVSLKFSKRRLKRYNSGFPKGPSKLEDLVVPRLVRPPKTSVANATEWSKDLDQAILFRFLKEFKVSLHTAKSQDDES